MFGIIIMGSRGRTTTLSSGQFYCPNCRAQRLYEHKRVTRYFTVYFVPVFPIETLAEFVECQACHAPFSVTVLQPPGQARGPVLIEGLDAQLKTGHAVQTIVDGLLQAGATKEDAAWAVYSAGQGRFAACDNCHLLYERSLAYCGQCGHKLVQFQGQPG